MTTPAFRASYTNPAIPSAPNLSVALSAQSLAFNLPSIFDILSEESLSSSLKPGLKNLIQVIHNFKFTFIN